LYNIIIIINNNNNNNNYYYYLFNRRAFWRRSPQAGSLKITQKELLGIAGMRFF